MPATSLPLHPARFSHLLSLSYEASIHRGDPTPGPGARTGEKEGWRLFVHEAAEAFGCQLAMIEYEDSDQPQRNFIAAGGLDGFEEAFSTARARGDEDQYQLAMGRQPPGTVQLGTDIVAPEQMRRSRSYLALAMPWHLKHFLMGTIRSGNGSGAFFSLGRTAREPAFLEADKAVIATHVLTHLTRSMTIQREVAAMRGANAMLSAVMHQAPTGLVVFDWQARPVVINQRAAEIFAATDGLSVTNSGLRAEDAVAQAQLNYALAATLEIAAGRPVPAPPRVVVVRRSRANPYRVSFTTLRPLGACTDFPRGSAVVAVIHDERRDNLPTVPAALRATYGLTRAEVRLCEGLLAGQSLVEAASLLSVSRNTAKTHLARVFDKTGVRSQMALLRLLTLGARNRINND